jgi:hypothetical protein
MSKRLPPPQLAGAERFGRMSATRRATGLAPHELAVVVAVLSCEIAEGGFPTREAIADITQCEDTSMPSRLVREGWLERAGKSTGNAVSYRGSDRAWRELGFVDARAKVAC